MNREELIRLFAPALNESLGTEDFENIMHDLQAIGDFVNYHEQPSLDLENEE